MIEYLIQQRAFQLLRATRHCQNRDSQDVRIRGMGILNYKLDYKILKLFRKCINTMFLLPNLWSEKGWV